MLDAGQADKLAGQIAVMREQIAAACCACGRAPESVGLLAVSKGHGSEAVAAAHTAGQRDFGENYCQEMLAKAKAVEGAGIVWHFIGHLQSRKAREMANLVDWVHSITRRKTAEALARHRSAELTPLNVCVQVSLFGEEQKDGIAVDGVGALVEEIEAFERLRLRGLMTILPQGIDDEKACQAYRRLYDCLGELRTQRPALDTLSMGMSGDWRVALAAGSTWLRLGTAVFGARPSANKG